MTNERLTEILLGIEAQAKAVQATARALEVQVVTALTELGREQPVLNEPPRDVVGERPRFMRPAAG